MGVLGVGGEITKWGLYAIWKANIGYYFYVYVFSFAGRQGETREAVAWHGCCDWEIGK